MLDLSAVQQRALAFVALVVGVAITTPHVPHCWPRDWLVEIMAGVAVNHGKIVGDERRIDSNVCKKLITLRHADEYRGGDCLVFVRVFV